MVYDTSTTHITSDELLDYVAARLPESREEAIEMHLGGCDACVEEVRQLRIFSAVWDDWTMQALDESSAQVAPAVFAAAFEAIQPPGESWAQVALAKALQQAQGQEEYSQWAGRLRHWQSRWTGQVEAAAHLVLQAADRTAQILTEGMEALTTPGQTWGFALGAAPVRARGRAGQGRTPIPLYPQARLRVRETAPGIRELQLRVEALPPHQPSLLVLLIPIDTETPPLVAGLVPTPDGTSFVARFMEVSPGEYLVAVEPMRDVGT